MSKVAGICLALLILAALPIHAAQGFFQPPLAGISVAPGSNYTVQWTSDWGLARIKLDVFQVDDSGGWHVHNLLDNVTDPGSYEWVVGPLDGLPQGNGFHFGLANTSDVLVEAGGFNSGALFINGSLSAVSTTATVGTHASATSSSLTTSNTSPTVAPTTSSSSPAASSPPPKPLPNTSSSRVPIIAGVVGAIVGTASVILIFITLKRDRHGQRLLVKSVRSAHGRLRHAQQRQYGKEHLEDPSSWYKAELDGKAVAPLELDNEVEVRELVASDSPVELPGDMVAGNGGIPKSPSDVLTK